MNNYTLNSKVARSIVQQYGMSIYRLAIVPQILEQIQKLKLEVRTINRSNNVAAFASSKWSTALAIIEIDYDVEEDHVIVNVVPLQYARQPLNQHYSSVYGPIALSTFSKSLQDLIKKRMLRSV